MGEETISSKDPQYLEKALQNRVWIIDPIDATAEFAHQVPFWGNSIGYAENGILKEGGIILPGTGEMMISDNGKVWYAREGQDPERWNFTEHLRILEPPATRFDDSCIVSLSQRVVKHAVFHARNTVNVLCSSVYAAILLATGRHAAVVTRAKLWDHAGYLVSLKNLGFHAWSSLPERNILSLKINPNIYILERGAEEAFALHDKTTVFARTAETVEKVKNMLIPEDDHL